MGERSEPSPLQKENVGLQNLMFRKCHFQTLEKSLTGCNIENGGILIQGRANYT